MSANKSKGTADDTGMSRKERRAAERSARKRGGTTSSGGGSKLSVPLIAGGAIVIAVLAVLVLVFAGGSGDDGSTVTAANAPPPADHLQDGRSLGDPEAPVKIDVYEDPRCPSCGVFTEMIEPLLIAGPVTRGEVFLTYKDMAFLGPESFDAAAAMRAAEDLDGKFWEYHDVVFHNQDGAITSSRLADMAELVGIDRDDFLAALDDPKHLNAVEEETAAARELGVNSTPTLVVNGELNPGVPQWEELSAQIADAAA
jgi:protein-disulfide isomerase